MKSYLDLKNEQTITGVYGRVVKNTHRKGYTYIRLLHRGEYLRLVYREDKCTLLGTKTEMPLVLGTLVKADGRVELREDAPNGFEIQLSALEILYVPSEPLSYPVGDGDMKLPLEEELSNRGESLMHPDNVLIFKTVADVMRSFRKAMDTLDFCEVHSPIITNELVTDKKRKFSVDYFGNTTFLSQTNYPYLEDAANALGGVYEIGTRFNAVAHGSPLYLNEYTVMSFETESLSLDEAISIVIDALKKHTKIKTAKQIKLNAALKLLGKSKTQGDLDPTDVVRLWEILGCDMYVVTHFPIKKKHPYDTKNNANLFYKGIKIASVGEHTSQTTGASICLERFIMALLNLSDIRKASLFPRDLHTFE